MATVARVAVGHARNKTPSTFTLYEHLFWQVEQHWTKWIMTKRRRKFVFFILLIGEATCREPKEDAAGVDTLVAVPADARFDEPLPSELWIHIVTFLPIAELSFR